MIFRAVFCLVHLFPLDGTTDFLGRFFKASYPPSMFPNFYFFWTLQKSKQIRKQQSWKCRQPNHFPNGLLLLFVSFWRKEVLDVSPLQFFRFSSLLWFFKSDSSKKIYISKWKNGKMTQCSSVFDNGALYPFEYFLVIIVVKRSTFCHTFMLRKWLQLAVLNWWVPKKSWRDTQLTFKNLKVWKTIFYGYIDGAYDALKKRPKKTVVPPSGNINKRKYSRQKARRDQCSYYTSFGYWYCPK
jgi:hypothetical protein